MSAAQPPRAGRWKKVEGADRKGLPKTAITEADKTFDEGRGAEKGFKATPVSRHTKGITDDTFRPTLFDFLAFDALSFYTGAERAGVQPRGKYPTGFAHIECMYAPEFNSHSENINLEVR